jgi:uncharacterized protein YuzE
MSGIKRNYDQEADVLYLSFDRSDHVTGVELADNIILRLDTGKISGIPPKAVGLTFVNFANIIAMYQGGSLKIPLAKLSNLPEDLRQMVLSIITIPPVSDFLVIEVVQAEEKWIMDLVMNVRAYRQAHPDEVMTFDSPEAVQAALEAVDD